MVRKTGKFLLGAAIAALSIAALPSVARAQSAGADKPVSVSIPAQSLSDALRQLAGASGLQLVYDTKITDGKTSPAVAGTMTGRAALAELLAGSGLSFQFSGDRTVIITGRTAGGVEDGVRSVGVVSVEGVSGSMPFGEMVSPVNGTNGSRDVETTEGTGSYTTGAVSIVSKTPQSLKDTPQTVSVVTSQQIADQNLISVRDILQTMPGVTTTPGGSGEEFNIYSRGFRVTTYSYDGGAPVSYDNGTRPMLNMAEFDSLQLARGGTGLFGGYGDPGGMVNLVRKKPLDHEQFTFEQDLGSWNNARSVIDYTGPVTKDKSLRARVVFSQQSKDYYYDIAKTEKTGIYGVFEYDLGPKTLVTFGSSVNWENSVLNVSGLPRYSDGTAINWPVSTCLCVPGGGENAKKATAFAAITHQISDNWSTKLNAIYDYQNVAARYVFFSADIPAGATSAPGNASGRRLVNPVRQIAVDYTVNGKFHLFGREHNVVVGANYQHINGDGGYTSFYKTVDVPDIFAFDPYTYVLQNPTNKDYSAPYLRSEAYGIYGNLTLQIFKNLRASVGMRYSATVLNAQFAYQNPEDGSTSFESVPDLRDRSHSQPNFGVNFDVTKNLAIYGSRQNIYQPQNTGGARYVLNGTTPPPITGSNTEVGAKWQSPNQRFNASLAGFKVLQTGILSADYRGTTPTASPILSDTKAQGIEVEVNGEILPGWQISASYTYNDNSFTESSLYDSTVTVRPKTSFTPRHLGKLWTTYRGAAGGALAGVILGGGINTFSESYQVATSYATGVEQIFEFTTKPYTVVALKGGYQVSDNIEMSVNVNNLLNKNAYLASDQQQIGAYNYYIEPRSVLVSTRFKW